MARYLTDPTIVKTNTGKRYYTTVIPETYVPSETPFTITARTGDRWDTIAFRYLGNAALWYLVANSNGGANGSIFITPGKQIIIPEI